MKAASLWSTSRMASASTSARLLSSVRAFFVVSSFATCTAARRPAPAAATVSSARPSASAIRTVRTPFVLRARALRAFILCLGLSPLPVQVGLQEGVEGAIHDAHHVGGFVPRAVVLDAPVVEHVAANLAAPLDGLLLAAQGGHLGLLLA